MRQERTSEASAGADDKLKSQALRSAEVTLAISILVDGEYPVNDHAHDILLTTQRLFASADVKMVKVVPPDESRAALPMLGTADGGR